MIENGKLADRILRENIVSVKFPLAEIVERLDKKKDISDLTDETERINSNLSTVYAGCSELLDSIGEILESDAVKLEGERADLLGQHFLKYGGDLREIDLEQGLRYVREIGEHFLDYEDDLESFGFFREDNKFYSEEKRLALFHVDFMQELNLKESRGKLKMDSGLEKFILALSGIDAECMSGVDYDQFESVVDSLREHVDRELVFDRNRGKFVWDKDDLFHPDFEVDTGQVTTYPSGYSFILEDEDVVKVIKMFKGIEVVETDEHEHEYEHCYREGCQMNEHEYERWFGPLDQDDEEYLYGKIESNRPVLIRRFLCHTFNLEGDERKLYDDYIKYQNKRFEGVKKFHESSFRDKFEHRMDDDQIVRIKEYCDNDFRQKTYLWLKVLDSAINCLLDQGHDIPKIIEIAETKLNPFKNEVWDITKELKPILAREYKG